MLFNRSIKIILGLCLTVILTNSCEVWDQYYFGYKTAVTDVVFHGKVIDQHGHPVSGARVEYFITGQFLAAGAGSGIALTDAQGRFSIKGVGAKIVFQAITADNIDYNAPTPKITPSLSRGRNPELMIRDWEQYTSNNPYIFNAWRVEHYDNVKHGRDGFILSPDGRTYTYVPFDSRRGKRFHEGKTAGLLHISCERDEMQDPGESGDWRVTLAPVDGGIQTTDDIYMNIAPEDGYETSITVEQKLSSPDYQKSIANQRYFFTANQGIYFGSLFIHYRPHFRNEECQGSIYYRVNLNGSRNLAVKAEELWQ